MRENVYASLLQGAIGFRPPRGDARWRQRRRLLRRPSSTETAQGRPRRALRDPRPGLRGELDQIQRYNLLGLLYTAVRFVVVGYRECACQCCVEQ